MSDAYGPALPVPRVRVVVIRAEGSTPREVGAGMDVWADGQQGTIGGGQLEWQVTLAARRMLTTLGRDAPAPAAWHRERLDLSLGPGLGQCCGGFVSVLMELIGSVEAASYDTRPGAEPDPLSLLVRPLAAGSACRRVSGRADAIGLPATVQRMAAEMLSAGRSPGTALVRRVPGGDWLIEILDHPSPTLFIYGAGHVGRALVHVLAGLNFDLYWVDTERGRFPDQPPAHARIVVAADPVIIAAEAPPESAHLVMTCSHALDLAICDAVMRQDRFVHLGLIGSATKRARFVRRLAGLGHTDSAIVRLVCPIGVPGLGGKAPAEIGVSVAADLIRRRRAGWPAADVLPGETATVIPAREPA